MSINKFKIVNDPVHGFIQIPYEILFDLIEHPYVQRLRRISQTGMLNLVFPGATHTRFHHALGAMHLMFLALEGLKLKGVNISQEEEKSALIAILLHDIGHGPFSHALESQILDNFHHEKISLILMNELNEQFSGQLTLAIKMFKGQYHRAFFHQLISSQLDVDRLDYLKRDSFYSGVSEGNVNTQRIISMMNVLDDELVIEQKGIYSIESFLTARMLMYWQVYLHKTSFVAEQYLVSLFQRARELSRMGQTIACTEALAYFFQEERMKFMRKEEMHYFTQLDDSDIWYSIKKWQSHPDELLSYFSQSLIKREFPKSLISAHPLSEKCQNRVKEKVAKIHGEDYANATVRQYRLDLVAYDSLKDAIYLKTKNASKIALHECENQILSQSLLHSTTKYVFTFPRGFFTFFYQD